MLPFLHEDQNDGNAASAVSQQNSADGHAGSTFECAEQDYLTVASKSKNVRKSTIALGVLFFIGLLSLVFMIKKTTPAAVSASTNTISPEEAKIEAAIAHLAGAETELSEGIETVVSKFYGVADMPQVGVDELAKNPFMLELTSGDGSGLNSGPEDADKMEVIRRRQLAQQAKDMQLLSIMNSDSSKCCMIDDKILYEGESINDFVVSEISDNFVKLSSGDTSVVLKLSE